MRSTLRYYEELKKENPIRSRQLEVYDSTAEKSVKLPAITRSKQKSLGNRPDFVLDCHQPGAKLKLYDTLRDKYLKAFFVNHGVQEAMRKNGMLDEAGNVLDFHAKPIKRVSMKEIIEGKSTKRQELDYSPMKTNTTESNFYQRSKSNPRISTNRISSKEPSKPVKIKLKFLSTEDLQQILAQQKEKINGELHEENKSQQNINKSEVINEKRLEESLPKFEETHPVNESAVNSHEKLVEPKEVDKSREEDKEKKEEDENDKDGNIEQQPAEDVEQSAEKNESEDKINNDPCFFVTQEHAT